MPEPVDLERLREFSDGSDEGVRTLAALLLDELEEAARALSDSADAGAWTELETLAHRIGGTAGACGAVALAAVLLNIESMAHAGQMEQAIGLLPQLDRELTAVRQFVRIEILAKR
jgi:HPt (histidine-containing phosphotransfer) domain-containing protein